MSHAYIVHFLLKLVEYEENVVPDENDGKLMLQCFIFPIAMSNSQYSHTVFA